MENLSNLEKRLLKNHKKLRLQCVQLKKMISELKAIAENEEEANSGKFINFFATFFAQLETLSCGKISQSRLRSLVEVSRINFEADFNVEFVDLKVGQKFLIENPAKIKSAVKVSDKNDHGKISKIFKKPYYFNGKMTAGQVEVLTFDQHLMEDTKTERVDLFKDEDGFLVLAPLKIGKSLKRARTLEIPPITLGKPVKLQLAPQILSPLKLWIGSTGKCLDIPTNHEDLYFLVTNENSFNLKLFSKNLQIGKLKLKE